MVAETVALIVLLTISILLNIAAAGYLLSVWKNKPSAEYKKIDEVEVERVEKHVEVEQEPRKEHNEPVEVRRSKEIAEKPTKPTIPAESVVLRSVENDLRSQDGQKRRAPQERSDRQRLQEPVGNEEFEKSMKMVVKFVNDYFDDAQKLPVVPDGDVSFLRIQKASPEKSETCDAILKDVKEIVLPNICHTQHPRYHAKFCGKSLADVMATTIATAIACDRVASPIIESLERALGNWLTAALAIPRMGERRDAIPSLIYSPRDIFLAIIRRACRNADKPSPDTARLVVYCGDDANPAIEEACHVARVKLRRVVTYERDSCAMTARNLEKQMEKDVARGWQPLMIVANYGSPMVAANDEIWDIVKVSASRNMWLHVDATYAGCEWLDENHRNHVHALLSEVTSCHVSFNTLLPYAGNVSIVWSTEKLEAARAPSDEDPLRFWILVRLYGFRSIRESVRRKLALGTAFCERIAQHADLFDVQHGNEHGVVLFQYKNKAVKDRVSEEDVSRMTSLFFNFLLTATSSALKFGLVRFHAKTMIRGVVNCERTNLAQMEESVSALVNCVDEFEETFKKQRKSLVEASTSELSESRGGSPNETTEKTQSGED